MKIFDHIESIIFTRRGLVLLFFAIITLFMLYESTLLQVDARFSKSLPLEHEYMKTFMQYRDEFAGANRILIALIAKDGNMFTPEFFSALKKATDEVFFIPGVDRSQVQSLFTPNVRFTEVVEDGITGGNVVPDNFDYSSDSLEQVRRNVIKSGIVGRLVANDFTGALISAQLQEINPVTGEKTDYVKIADTLEKNIRQKLGTDTTGSNISYHIIGFAKIIGDISDGVRQIIWFFVITLLLVTLLVYIYSQSFILALLPISCSLIAVIWQLGILSLSGFGMDPFSILVPFLIFAIGVSHGVQMISTIRMEIFCGMDCVSASRMAFRRLLLPGTIALISDTVGFITIILINIEVIQEMAITASIGVALIILTNIILLPVLVSFLDLRQDYLQRLQQRAGFLLPWWQKLAQIINFKNAVVITVCALLLMFFGIWKGSQVKVGDQEAGIPELRADSRYNRDVEAITKHFSIGVDILGVITEAHPEGCVDYHVMDDIDSFAWQMQNTDGVQSVLSLAGVAKIINAGWNEGNMKWRVLPRNQSALSQSVAYVPTSSGLLNSDCSVMPVLIFTRDHKAETIDKIITSINNYLSVHDDSAVNFRLASGNVGVMAATNDEIRSAQYPILVYVFTAIFLLCLVSFRSLPATLSIILPLALVSLLTYALMSYLNIGLKVNTLPVVALGAGIGVDYGIYIYNRMLEFTREGIDFREAFKLTLASSGSAVLFTALTLTVSVMTWVFSPLKFQADMGLLLMFMFFVNMLGAVFLMPVLASLFQFEKTGI